MNNYLLFGILGAFVISSFMGIAALNIPVLAQENMTMNTSESAPVKNTSEISDTGAGLDANMMKGDNMSGMNMTGSNMTSMQ